MSGIAAPSCATLFYVALSSVYISVYVRCNYQGEIFAINEAEFKVSAASLLNLEILNRKYFRFACCMPTLSNFKIMRIIFGKTLSIFEKNETYRPAYYFALLLKRYFTKMPRNIRDYKAVKMSN